MSDSLVVCEVDPELKEKLRKFRFRKETDNAAIIMKVDKDRQMVVLEEEFQTSILTTLGLGLLTCKVGIRREATTQNCGRKHFSRGTKNRIARETAQVRGLQLQVRARGRPSFLPSVLHLLQSRGYRPRP
uniref:Glia maturation factor gamma n=1 Tax=Ursus maritimus TaxID=29073 RepID=A0A452UZH5_URSMA